MRKPGELLPELVFVTRRVVCVGDELTFDYGQIDNTHTETHTHTHAENTHKSGDRSSDEGRVCVCSYT